MTDLVYRLLFTVYCLLFWSYKMELNRELFASRRELSQLCWQDDSSTRVMVTSLYNFSF